MKPKVAVLGAGAMGSLFGSQLAYHPTDPGMGGHYHFDVTPEAVHCRGWFAPAETVYRVGNIYARLRDA